MVCTGTTVEKVQKPAGRLVSRTRRQVASPGKYMVAGREGTDWFLTYALSRRPAARSGRQSIIDRAVSRGLDCLPAPRRQPFGLRSEASVNFGNAQRKWGKMRKLLSLKNKLSAEKSLKAHAWYIWF
uniref:tryptorubin family RiPP precursor n=1 Tax=Streptomyces corallincola TaxID=2851888 RepID=UPI003555F940